MQFAGLEMDALPNWFDITHDLEADSPFTLAKDDGIGALQFTFARYEAGKDPRIGAADLKSLLRKFEAAENLPEPSETSESDGWVSSTYQLPGQLLKVWYLTNGLSVVFATYVAVLPTTTGDLQRELNEASRIVESIAFPVTRRPFSAES